MAAATGAAQLRALGEQAKVMADRGILLAARRAIRVEAKPLIEAMQEAAREKLPKSGGLNEYVAAQKWTVSTLTGARSAGVRIRNKRRGAGQTDKGFVRHPVFGHWLEDQPSQPIPGAAGWATDTAAKRAPAVVAGISAQLDRAFLQAFGGR